MENEVINIGMRVPTGVQAKCVLLIGLKAASLTQGYTEIYAFGNQ